jgi:hypothetical protein
VLAGIFVQALVIGALSYAVLRKRIKAGKRKKNEGGR